MIRKLLPLAAIATAGLLTGAPALADSTGLLSQTGLISGKQSFVFAMQVTAPGTLSVQLADLNWQGRLNDLTFSLSDGKGLLDIMPSGRVSALAAGGGIQASPVHMFEVTAPGTYYAYVSGSATGPYGLGLYSLNATFAASTVPLPAAGWLLFSGVGGLLALARRRRAGVLRADGGAGAGCADGSCGADTQAARTHHQ